MVIAVILMVSFHGIYGGLIESNGIYPLVISYIAIEHMDHLVR